MPHVIVKMCEGKGLPEKQALAKAVAEAISGFGCDIRKVSVSVDDVRPENWMEAVYQPDIIEGRALLVKAPGYGPVSEKL